MVGEGNMLEMKCEMAVRNMKDDDVIKKFQNDKAWGLCTMVDLKQCNPETIRDPEKIHEFIIKLCDLIEMKRFGDPTIVHFGPNAKGRGLLHDPADRDEPRVRPLCQRVELGIPRYLQLQGVCPREDREVLQGVLRCKIDELQRGLPLLK